MRKKIKRVPSTQNKYTQKKASQLSRKFKHRKPHRKQKHKKKKKRLRKKSWHPRRKRRFQKYPMLRRRLSQRRSTKHQTPNKRNACQEASILVLDHFVPHYDKDTGSRTLFQYIQLLLQMGLCVRFAAFDNTRYEPYTSMLERMGVNIISGEPDALQAWLKRHGQGLTFAYINRPHVAQRYFDLLRQYSKAKMIYNSVDFEYLREQRRAELENDPQGMLRAMELKQQAFHLFQKSDVVYTVSEYEKTLLLQELPNKRVVTVPIFFYDPPFPIGPQRPFHERHDLLFVGGFNHTPNRDGVFWFVENILPQIISKLPGIRFHIVGSNPPSEVVALQSDNILVSGYIPDEELDQVYSQSRLVVAPLRYGAGVKGKIIEAIAVVFQL